MAAVTSHTVTTLTEFTEVVERELAATRARNGGVKRPGNWYRGHSSHTYKLQPTLYRHPATKAVHQLLNLEGEMMADFLRLDVIVKEAAGRGDWDDDKLKLLCYMQHNQVPTRLLDWTGNPYIGLHFALAEQTGRNANKRHDAVVWVLDPWAWNERALREQTWGRAGPATTGSLGIQGYAPRDVWAGDDFDRMQLYPTALRGPINSQRIFAQKGSFTIFGKQKDPMEKIYDKATFPDGCLVKIVVPAERRYDLLETLINIGYTDSVAYPDLHGLALEIRRLRGFRM